MRFQRAGLMHVLTISGLHISIVGMGVFGALQRCGMDLFSSGFFSFIVILIYGTLTGSGAATLRAVIMFILEIGARLSGRSFDRVTALAVSAIFLLLECPAWLYNSSFLLSFSVVMGVTAALPVIHRITECKSKTGRLFFSMWTLFFSVLPVQLYFYGELSVLGFFLNLLILPTVGIVLGSGIMVLIAGSVWRPAGVLCAVPGRLLLQLYEGLAEQISWIPYATWILGRPSLKQIILYLLDFGIPFTFLQIWHHRKKKIQKSVTEKRNLREKRNFKILKRIVICMYMSASLFLLLPQKEEILKITCLDVGQGDGVVIQLPDGKCFLSDFGSSDKNKTGIYTLLPYLKIEGISVLDGIFLSHADQDHVSGILELLELSEKHLSGIRTRAIFISEFADEEKLEKLLKLAETEKIVVYRLRAGDQLKSGESKITILSAEDAEKGNDDSLVYELNYGNFEALFTGDIEREAEIKLLQKLEEVDFLKVAHHGSASSTTAEFLEKTKPKISVISCAERNRYGHPSEEVIERLEQAGSRVFYTMKQGAVTVASDGEKILVSAYLSEN